LISIWQDLRKEVLESEEGNEQDSGWEMKFLQGEKHNLFYYNLISLTIND
jgi:hypothetical protein